jgi:hypothetical protein
MDTSAGAFQKHRNYFFKNVTSFQRQSPARTSVTDKLSQITHLFHQVTAYATPYQIEGLKQKVTGRALRTKLASFLDESGAQTFQERAQSNTAEREP